jgi:hypothetical protein
MASASRAAALRSRAISICIQDSRVPSGAPTPTVLPAASRDMAMTGWMTSRTGRPRSLIAALTESTRNGMSSLTISTIVYGDDKPSRAAAGL